MLNENCTLGLDGVDIKLWDGVSPCLDLGLIWSECDMFFTKNWLRAVIAPVACGVENEIEIFSLSHLLSVSEINYHFWFHSLAWHYLRK